MTKRKDGNDKARESREILREQKERNDTDWGRRGADRHFAPEEIPEEPPPKPKEDK